MTYESLRIKSWPKSSKVFRNNEIWWMFRCSSRSVPCMRKLWVQARGVNYGISRRIWGRRREPILKSEEQKKARFKSEQQKKSFRFEKSIRSHFKSTTQGRGLAPLWPLLPHVCLLQFWFSRFIFETKTQNCNERKARWIYLLCMLPIRVPRPAVSTNMLAIHLCFSLNS